MNLYLVRHGAAARAEEDPERPLTAAGLEAASRVAAFLGEGSAVSVREIRHSTKLRARQTAAALAAGLRLSVPLKQVSYLEPQGEVSDLAASLSREAADLMLVGHLPHLNRLASYLLAADADAEFFDFPECGVLRLRRVGGSGEMSKWAVVWMLAPSLT